MQEKRVNGVLQSVIPETTDFGYTYFASMIPPFKPKTMLVLGYGLGTIPRLTRRLWGSDIYVIGVDKDNEVGLQDYVINQDAFEFVKIRKDKFEYVIVDLFEGNDIPQQVFEEEFIKNLYQITKKLLAVNMTEAQDYITPYQKYFDVDLIKLTKGNRIYFLKPKEKI